MHKDPLEDGSIGMPRGYAISKAMGIAGGSLRASLACSGVVFSGILS
jgi:hypothetical protein